MRYIVRMSGHFIGVDEVAALLRLPVSTVYAAARRGLLPTIHVGKRLRFDPAALRDWAARGGSPLPERQR